MSTQAIQCPQCGGSDPSPEGPDGIHVCTWCGVHYRMEDSGAAVVARAASARRRIWLGGLGVLVVAVAIRMTDTDEPSPLPAELDAPSTQPVAPMPTPVAQTVPEPVPLTASFEMHAHGDPSSASFRVVGRVENTSSVPIGQVEVQAIFLDASGAEVYSDHGYSDDHRLAPGESAPVGLIISSAPEFESMRFETKVRKPIGDAADYGVLELVSFEPRKDDFSGMSFSGKVAHRGETPVQFVQVRVTGYDVDDRIVGFSKAFAAGAEGLEPGDTGRYHMTAIGWLGEAVRIETDFVRP